MAINPVKLIKMLKRAAGDGNGDEVLELLSSLGIELEAQEVTLEAAAAVEAFTKIAEQTVADSLKLYNVTATFKGLPVHAFLMIGKPEGA